MNLETIMTRKIIAVTKDSTLLECAKKMKEYDIGFLPICDETKIIGVITDRDIVVKALVNEAKLTDSVENYMTKNIITIPYNAEEEELFNLIKKEKVKRLLITDGKKVVGVISTADMIHLNQSERLLESLKCLWTINRNTDDYPTEIDEFYL